MPFMNFKIVNAKNLNLLTPVKGTGTEDYKYLLAQQYTT